MKKLNIISALILTLVMTFSFQITAFAEECEHIPDDAVKENVVLADYNGDGSYDEVVYCSICSEELSRNNIILHNYLSEETAPTCLEKGYTTYTCTNCNDEYVDDYVNSLGGHLLIKSEIIPPSCTEKGYTEFKCENCNKEFQCDFIDELGHDYVETVIPPDCVNQGYTTHKCSRCDDLYNDTSVDALGHKPAEAVKENEVDASCTEKGSYDEVVYCSVCNEELSRVKKEVEALGHEYGEWTLTTEAKEATCTEAGATALETRTCSRCNINETRGGEEIKKLGHSYEFTKIDWTTLDKKNNKVDIIETCKRCKDVRNKAVSVDCEVSIDKDVYVINEKWASTVSINYTYSGKKPHTITVAPTSANAPKKFTTSKKTDQLACTFTHDGIDYKLPNIYVVNSRLLFFVRSSASEPYTEYILVNKSSTSANATVLLSKSGAEFKCKNYLNSRSKSEKGFENETGIVFSADMKKDFNITAKHSKDSAYTNISLKPKSVFAETNNKKNYYITVSGKDGSKTCNMKVTFKARPSVNTPTARTKGFKITWSKTKIVSGYKVRYSTSSSMSGAKTVTVKGQDASSKIISNLKKKKRYYIQVRSYHTVGKNTYYSEWSETKSVKTK